MAEFQVDVIQVWDGSGNKPEWLLIQERDEQLEIVRLRERAEQEERDRYWEQKNREQAAEKAERMARFAAEVEASQRKMLMRRLIWLLTKLAAMTPEGRLKTERLKLVMVLDMIMLKKVLLVRPELMLYSRQAIFADDPKYAKK